MSKKELKTNAMRILDSKKINYEMITYESKDGKIDGISVAHKIGIDEANVFKTLVSQGTSKELYVFVIPVAEELSVKTSQVDAAVKLIDEGCTIPFIARYRKEVTGALNDEQLRELDDRLKYLRNLEDRKTQVIASIEEQGKLTDELKEQILKAETMVLVEDLYRPYKQKRRTRATIAREKGLEQLAEYIKGQDAKEDVLVEAEKYVSDEEGKEVKSAKEAIAGALDIIAEQISDVADYRTLTYA